MHQQIQMSKQLMSFGFSLSSYTFSAVESGTRLNTSNGSYGKYGGKQGCFYTHHCCTFFCFKNVKNQNHLVERGPAFSIWVFPLQQCLRCGGSSHHQERRHIFFLLCITSVRHFVLLLGWWHQIPECFRESRNGDMPPLKPPHISPSIYCQYSVLPPYIIFLHPAIL